MDGIDGGEDWGVRGGCGGGVCGEVFALVLDGGFLLDGVEVNDEV